MDLQMPQKDFFNNSLSCGNLQITEFDQVLLSISKVYSLLKKCP